MSSDIQRKVTFISLSWHRPPLSAQRANLNWWPTLGRMLFGFSKIKGECKAFRTGGVALWMLEWKLRMRTFLFIMLKANLSFLLSPFA